MTQAASVALRCEDFPPETLETLFQAVLVDDDVDPVVRLPERIPLDFTPAQLRRGYCLCRQLWRDGVDRGEALRLVGILLRKGDLDPADRLAYKYIRAKYKHLRFALVLYGTAHKAPRLFKLTTAVMGLLQDAFRNRRRGAVLGYGLALRLLLARPFWAAVRHEVDAVRLDDPAGFRAFLQAEVARLKQAMQAGDPTGDGFHAMRKIVSRQVSFFDTLRTLEAREDAFLMSRYLSAINGLMGSLHDDLVEQAAHGAQNYHRDRFPLPQDIRWRLEELTQRYPA